MKKILFATGMSLLLFSAGLMCSCEKDNDSKLSISSFSPLTARSTQTVTITGSNFPKSDLVVAFNGVEATVVSATSSKIEVTVPRNVNCSGKITVSDKKSIGTSSEKFSYIITYNTVKTYAGTGTATFADGISTKASFRAPLGLAIDSDDNIYVADQTNYRIRKIAPVDTMVTTISGNGSTTYYVDGRGVIAQFRLPYGVAVDNQGVVYVADQTNYRIRKIVPDMFNTTSTVAGYGVQGYLDAGLIKAEFDAPSGVMLDKAGNLYVCDSGNNRIRKITTSGVGTFAGSNAGLKDGRVDEALFNYPTSMISDNAGNMYIADQKNNCIRKITPSGIVSTVAGSATAGTADGTGANAAFNLPSSIALDAAGNLYVADKSNHKIRKIAPNGEVTTLAGTGASGFLNGDLLSAQFNNPYGMVVDSKGNIYVADTNNNRIRVITEE